MLIKHFRYILSPLDPDSVNPDPNPEGPWIRIRTLLNKVNNKMTSLSSLCVSGAARCSELWGWPAGPLAAGGGVAARGGAPPPRHRQGGHLTLQYNNSTHLELRVQQTTVQQYNSTTRGLYITLKINFFYPLSKIIFFPPFIYLQ